MTPKHRLLIIGITVALLTALAVFWNMKPPKEVELAKMVKLQEAIESYAAEHGRAPETLEDLAGEPALTLDRTGHPFQYKVDGWEVTLTTFGGDQKPGGVAFKADRDHIFLLPSP